MSLNGVINLYKPPGMTSAQAVAIVKRQYGCKTGHAGTLDPEASGVLPILVGQGTRISEYVMAEEKQYLAEISFGFATDTQDSQGATIEIGDILPTEEVLSHILEQFKGYILQKPPKFSALKVKGNAAYNLARQGQHIDLKARKVFIRQIDLVRKIKRNSWLLRIVCGKGTYIRTLCHDIGTAINCPAHMSFLLRERTGVFSVEQAATIEEIENTHSNIVANRSWFCSVCDALSSMPKLRVKQPASKALLNGAEISDSQVFDPAPKEQTEVCLLVGVDILGIYYYSNNRYKPLKVLRTNLSPIEE